MTNNTQHAADWKLVPHEPTEEMLNAARDWSIKKNGMGVGNDQATGCYAAMLAAAPAQPPIGDMPACWITKDQLRTVEDESSDAWVYWRESNHVAEDDEIPLFTHPPKSAAPIGDVQQDDALAEVVKHTIETIGRQLDLIAERAPGNYLDKIPVCRSLTQHKIRLERALSAPRERQGGDK